MSIPIVSAMVAKKCTIVRYKHGFGVKADGEVRSTVLVDEQDAHDWAEKSGRWGNRTGELFAVQKVGYESDRESRLGTSMDYPGFVDSADREKLRDYAPTQLRAWRDAKAAHQDAGDIAAKQRLRGALEAAHAALQSKYRDMKVGKKSVKKIFLWDLYPGYQDECSRLIDSAIRTLEDDEPLTAARIFREIADMLEKQER